MIGLYTYSPKDIVVSLSGLVIKDFAKGSFIEIAMNNPPFTSVAGIRGKSTRKYSRDKSGRVTIRLQQTSPINDILSHIHEKDQVSFTGLLSLSVTDASGSTGILLKNCYIASAPSLGLSGDDLMDREWVINFEIISRYHVGGNKNPTLNFLSHLN